MIKPSVMITAVRKVSAVPWTEGSILLSFAPRLVVSMVVHRVRDAEAHHKGNDEDFGEHFRG
jgi:hypothetical protein